MDLHKNKKKKGGGSRNERHTVYLVTGDVIAEKRREEKVTSKTCSFCLLPKLNPNPYIVHYI